MTTTSTIDLTPVLQRLDALSAQVAAVDARQRKTEELFAEMTPVARAALGTAIERLDDLEKKGYFEFGKELLGVGQRIVEGFSPDDVRQLGDAVVSILEAVRAMTQPEVLQIAADASAAMLDADDVKPMGLFGLARATRNDDVKKGLALVVEMLKRVGKGVNAMATSQELAAGDRKAKLAALLGPRRERANGGRKRLPPGRGDGAEAAPRSNGKANGKAAAVTVVSSGEGCGAPAAKPVAATTFEGVELTAAGHLVDPKAWSRSLGEKLATAQGMALTDAHWKLIEAARDDFATTEAAPNIRRLTQVAGVTTKDIYALFPKAPGRTIAKIAGLPKPAGCL